MEVILRASNVTLNHYSTVLFGKLFQMAALKVLDLFHQRQRKYLAEPWGQLQAVSQLT